MHQTRWLYAVALMAAGCSPGVDIRPNPGPDDHGLRYYRPKPYLLVEPAAEKADGKDGPGQGAALDPRGKLFKVSLHYLPDFGEEYAVKVRPGLGACNVSLTLQDGWNLTALNQNLDSKTSENLTAAAAVLKAAAPGGLVVGEKAREVATQAPVPAAPEFFVHASNVPIGYYESVLGRDPHSGRKSLYGFRYVGFLPFAPCPIQPMGEAAACCADGSMHLYGLVFEDGIMVFKPLPTIDGTRAPVLVGPPRPAVETSGTPPGGSPPASGSPTPTSPPGGGTTVNPPDPNAPSVWSPLRDP